MEASKVRKRKRKLTEEEVDNADVALKRSIGELALRVGRSVLRAKGEKAVKITSALALLNQAQGLVGFDNSKARRLANQVRRILNVRD